jgi:hypothetical protein
MCARAAGERTSENDAVRGCVECFLIHEIICATTLQSEIQRLLCDWKIWRSHQWFLGLMAQHTANVGQNLVWFD